MNKQYECKQKTIKDALNEIDNFTTMMNKFNNKHNDKYSYNMSIEELINQDNKWVIKLNVKSNGE